MVDQFLKAYFINSWAKLPFMYSINAPMNLSQIASPVTFAG